MQEIQHLLVVLVAPQMNLLQQLVLGHAVDGEHIDIETAHIVDMHALYQRGGIVLYLAKGEGVVFVVLGTDGL